MEPLGYYKWHWQAWRANRRVQRMPWEAKGLYRELLDEFWVEGSLPNELDELADICGISAKEFCQWWEYISPCFEERDGRLYNAKMDEQRTSIDRARVAMAQGGQAGGRVSNSSTRAKGTLEVPEGQPDIEEKRREEKSKKPSRASREGDNRHAGFKDAFFHSFTSHNQIEPPWDGQEGKALSKFLAATPKITQEHWETILKHRFASEGANGDALSTWVKDAQRWYKSPLDRFGKPKGVSSQPKFMNVEEAY